MHNVCLASLSRDERVILDDIKTNGIEESCIWRALHYHRAWLGQAMS